MIPTLAQVSTLNAPLESDVADYAAGQCRSLELWLGKVESYLESHAVDDLRRLLDEHQVTAPVASFQGGLLTSQGEQRQGTWDHFARRLQLCQALGVRTLVVSPDFAPPLTQEDLDRAMQSLTQAALQAGAHGVRLALEFNARAAFCNNLQTAASLVGETGSPHLGVCFDVFHYHTGPSKPEDLGYLSAQNLFHIQLCDLAGVARELATDSDRILPGDGDIELGPMLDHFRAIGYADCVSIELMNPQIWQIPPLQFGEIACTSLRKLLGQATMERNA